MSKNPFTIGIVQTVDDFCNRTNEQEDLLKYARGGSNVVLCSPRRYGKSSLVHVVLGKLKKEGFVTAYVDLFPVSSEQDFIARFSNSIFKNIGKGADPKTFVEKISGIFSRFIPTLEVTSDGCSISAKYDPKTKSEVLLDDLMEGLHSYVKKRGSPACIALDEFQEITEIPESKKIEGILRSHMQSHRDIAYFFVGSRRRILQDMFNNKARPFYKSAFFYALKEISQEDFVPYIVRLFKKTEKSCDPYLVKEIYSKVRGYPYYVQKFASIVWDNTVDQCTHDIVERSFDLLINSEAIDFEGSWSSLTLAQKTVLKQLASEPTETPFSKTHLEKIRMSSGGLQKVLKILFEKDVVEKTEPGLFRLTDPAMEGWLKRNE